MTKANEANKRYRAKHPWMRHFDGARARCKGGNKYAKRGIKFLMTKEDFEFLWFRDKAWELKQPSIDRKNSRGNYELYNCRFIEMDLNREPQPIMQFSKEGSFIANYGSASEAAKAVKGDMQNICSVANRQRSTAYGYKWQWGIGQREGI